MAASTDSVNCYLVPTRKLVHMSMLTFAFLLPFLTWQEAAGCALVALLFNATVLPRLAVDLRKRPVESGAGAEPAVWTGIILYPISVLILVLLFRWHMEVVAAAWAILALGDGVASIAGENLGGPHIPWNSAKTWAGFGGFVVAGTMGAYVLMRWVAPSLPVDKAFIVSLAGSIVGALVESAPIRLDDNLTVPLCTAGFIFCVLLIERSALASNTPYLGLRIVLGVAICAIVSVGALAIRTVDRSGALAGFLLGFAVYLGYGWRSFSVLCAFFVLGSIATRLGYSKKARTGIAEGRGGARSWREALANTLAGAFFSILVITTHHEAAFLAALIASFAEAAGDTMSSEIGQWLSGRAYLITTFKPVPAGENGGISLLGSLAGAAGCLATVAVGFALGLCRAKGGLVILTAAVAGNILDSVLGATLEHCGLVTNGVVNFMGTSFAGALALVLMFHFRLG